MSYTYGPNWDDLSLPAKALLCLGSAVAGVAATAFILGVAAGIAASERRRGYSDLDQ